jgi:hypothetical protein
MTRFGVVQGVGLAKQPPLRQHPIDTGQPDPISVSVARLLRVFVCVCFRMCMVRRSESALHSMAVHVSCRALYLSSNQLSGSIPATLYGVTALQ